MEQIQVGIYARISDDVDDTGLGVERQETDARHICAARGWGVAEVYVDNDLSAYKRTVQRPAFERMLMDLGAGKIQGIVCYDLDRFARQPSDLERAIHVYEDVSGAVFASVQGDVNLQTPDGKTMARVLVAFANKASMDTARRVARKHLENAQAGKPVGGFRPFGWKADKRTLDPTEADLVRQAIELLHAGVSMGSIVENWAKRGVKTTAGKPWTSATLRQYLKNPRLYGVRVHQGKVLHGEDGLPVRGQWEPLISAEEWERVQVLLSGPERRSRVPKKGSRHYLLTGLLRCRVCNGLLYGNARKDGKGSYYYACNGTPGNRHTVSGSGIVIDKLVSDLTLALMTMDTEEIERAPWGKQAILDEKNDAIRVALNKLGEGGIRAELIFAQVERLEREVAELQMEKEAWIAATNGPRTTQETPDQWNSMTTDQRRGFIAKYFDAFYLSPSTKRGNTFDPLRLVPVQRVIA